MTAAQTARKPRIGANDVFGTLATNLCIQGCTIVQGVILARLLGPVGRGEFAAAILWPTIFAALGGFGVSTALARRAAHEPNLAGLTRAGLILSVITAACTSGLCFLLMPLLLTGQGAHLIAMSRWFVPIIFCNQLALVFIFIDQGSGNFREFNWTRLIVNPIYLALVVALWLAGRSDVFLFVLALLVANFMVVVVRMVRFLRGDQLFGPIRPLGPIVREATRYGLADLLRPLYQYVDKALFLYLLGVRDLGLYTVALAASGVAACLATATSSVTFGIAAKDDGARTFERIAKLFRCSGWLWLVIGSGLAIAMPILLPAVFGREFSGAVWPAILLIPASAFSGQAGILEQSLRAQGRPFVGLEAQILGLLIMVPVAYVGSKLYGILGIVLAYNLAQLFCLMMFCVRARSHFRRQSLSDFLPKRSDLKTVWSPIMSFLAKHRVSMLKVTE
jgi:enterobacterial common antigen flippase